MAEKRSRERRAPVSPAGSVVCAVSGEKRARSTLQDTTRCVLHAGSWLTCTYWLGPLCAVGYDRRQNDGKALPRAPCAGKPCGLSGLRGVRREAGAIHAPGHNALCPTRWIVARLHVLAKSLVRSWLRPASKWRISAPESAARRKPSGPSGLRGVRREAGAIHAPGHGAVCPARCTPRVSHCAYR